MSTEQQRLTFLNDGGHFYVWYCVLGVFVIVTVVSELK